jgi:hypothetical protein
MPCQQQSNCGDGGSLCVQLDDGNGYCGVDCSQTMCSEAGAQCDQIQDQNGDIVGENCLPASGACSTTADGGTATCITCSQDSDCGAGNLCITEDGFDFFCATDCSQTQTCTNAADQCEEDFDASGNAVDGCAPSDGSCDD